MKKKNTMLSLQIPLDDYKYLKELATKYNDNNLSEFLRLIYRSYIKREKERDQQHDDIKLFTKIDGFKRQK